MDNSVERELRDLMELLTDSELGYKEAAERASDERVKALMMRLSSGRGPEIIDLGMELRKEGQEVPTGGTIKGTLHRAWMDIRSALTQADDQAMLAECVRGETYLAGRYEEVLKNEHIEPYLKQELQSQLALVHTNLTTVRVLEQEMARV